MEKRNRPWWPFPKGHTDAGLHLKLVTQGSNISQARLHNEGEQIKFSKIHKNSDMLPEHQRDLAGCSLHVSVKLGSSEINYAWIVSERPAFSLHEQEFSLPHDTFRNWYHLLYCLLYLLNMELLLF